jgi:hypothetical protein
MNTHMNTLALLATVAASGLMLAGCNKAENPAEVQHDVARAQAEGNRDVAAARADAQKNSIDAQTDVAEAVADHKVADAIDQSHEADKVAMKGDENVQIAQAEATHRVSIQKCEAMSGEMQKECKDSADADLKAAKEFAEMRRDANR